MAKRLKAADKAASKPKKPIAPDHLTIQLFADGMSLLHRAGLGGLACTLKAIERQYENGLLSEAKLPAPFDGDKPPWEVTDGSITLHFGKPEKARDYLERLFEFSFQIRDGIIYLPGQYPKALSTNGFTKFAFSGRGIPLMPKGVEHPQAAASHCPPRRRRKSFDAERR